MNHIDIELLRLQADRELARPRRGPPRGRRAPGSQPASPSRHSFAWAVLLAVLTSIPSTTAWWG